MFEPEYDECGVETQSSWATRRADKRAARRWNIEACINTIKQYHPACECPTEQECASVGDSWVCESCLCDEAKSELTKLIEEM